MVRGRLGWKGSVVSAWISVPLHGFHMDPIYLGYCIVDCVEGNHDRHLHPNGFHLWKVVSRSWAEAGVRGGRGRKVTGLWPEMRSDMARSVAGTRGEEEGDEATARGARRYGEICAGEGGR